MPIGYKEMSKDKVQIAVKNVFSYASNFHFDRNTVIFVVDHDVITFNKLFDLSTALSTKNINFSDVTTEDGCETCGYGAYSRVSIYVKDIKLD